MLLPLDGLLDYVDTDREERTAEVSLAAEALYELLARDAANVIVRAILAAGGAEGGSAADAAECARAAAAAAAAR